MFGIIKNKYVIFKFYPLSFAHLLRVCQILCQVLMEEQNSNSPHTLPQDSPEGRQTHELLRYALNIKNKNMQSIAKSTTVGQSSTQSVLELCRIFIYACRCLSVTLCFLWTLRSTPFSELSSPCLLKCPCSLLPLSSNKVESYSSMLCPCCCLSTSDLRGKEQTSRFW